ncbi:MAG TPA: metal ABC transporter permease [Myxococcota bacterium]|jgi:zinc transport system permease protein|nr:metal ABC transporter permease [Myxococcota bacterium]
MPTAPPIEVATDLIPPFFSADAYSIWGPAVLANLVAAVMLGVLGVYVVLRRVVFVSAALSQISTVGVALGFYLGAFVALPVDGPPGFYHTVLANPVVLSFALVAVGALALAFEPRRSHLGRDARVGAVFVASGAAVVLLLASPRVVADRHEVEALLFGEAMAVAQPELIALCVAAGTILLVHALFYKEFLFVSLDRPTAQATGLAAGRWDAVLMLTLAAAISVATRAIGPVAVFGYLVLPSTAALLVARRMWSAFLLAMLFGALSAGLGYYVSWVYDLPTKSTGVAVAAVLIALGWLVRRFRPE